MLNDVETTINKAILSEFKNRADIMPPGKSRGFIQAIWRLFDNYTVLSYEGSYVYESLFSSVNGAYRELCGRRADDCATLDDFFNPNLMSALRGYFGGEEVNRIKEECVLASEGPCPHYDSRQSCRSRQIGDYADVFFKTMASVILFACYNLTVEEMITVYSRFPMEIDDHIALELHRGNKGVYAQIKDGVTSDSSSAELRRRFLKIIVKSGAPTALGFTRKLASTPEQLDDLLFAISNSCHVGPVGSHACFIKLILDNGLCRYPSVASAFDCWTGLIYGNKDMSAVENRMSMALRFLNDESAAMVSLFTGDITEISIALWALRSRDMHKAADSARLLLESPEKFRRLTGWYHITLTGSDSYRHSVAVKHLYKRDREELAWVFANLHINVEFLDSDNDKNEDEEKSGLTKTYYDKAYPDNPSERANLFDQLADAAVFMSSKKKEGSNLGDNVSNAKNTRSNKTVAGVQIIKSIYSRKNVMFTEYSGSAFPWLTYSLVNFLAPLRLMLALAAYDRSNDLTIRLKDYIPIMDDTHRRSYYCVLLNPKIPEQRAIILAGLTNRGSYARIGIANRLKHYPLGGADIECLLKTLTTKNASLRKAIVELIGKQGESLVRRAVGSLLDSPNKNQMIAGIELIDLYSKDNPLFRAEHRKQIAAQAMPENYTQGTPARLKGALSVNGAVPSVNKLIAISEYTEENGYGLYNPGDEVFDIVARAAKRPDIETLSDLELKALIVPDEKAVILLFERIADTFIKYWNYQYSADDWSGTYKNVTLGNDSYRTHVLAGKSDYTTEHFFPSWLRGGFAYPITHYPLADTWLAAAGDFAENGAAMAAIESLWAPKHTTRYAEWFYSLFSGYPIEHWPLIDKIHEAVNLRRLEFGKVREILFAIKRYQNPPLFNFALSAYINLIRKIPLQLLGAEYEEREKGADDSFLYMLHPPRKALSNDYIAYWRNLAYSLIGSDAEFADYFNEMWYEYLTAGRQEFYGLTLKDVFWAYHLGLISDAAVYMYFTTGAGASDRMESLTSPNGNGRVVLKAYPAIKDILAVAIDRIADIEENRGEMPAALSELAARIRCFDGGCRHFAKLLASLGSAQFCTINERSYMRGAGNSRQESLCRLLRACRPACGDTPEGLLADLKKAEIPIKLALRAAVYAPVWAEILEKSLAINGLKRGVWFLHAHLRSSFSDELETEASAFSYAPHRQREYGVFDTFWFFEAYKALGSERFDELYEYAKPIADSEGRYNQLRLFFDAVLGKLAKGAAVAAIVKSRDQAMLCAYALIPLDSTNPGDAFERYELILRFRNESGKSNNARQKKERDACQIAFKNLAITTGYGEAERMIWAYEGQNPGFLRSLTEPRSISGTDVWLYITKYGAPELIVSINGETPAALTKEQSHNEHVTAIRSAMIRLREQRKRAPVCFEEAMEIRSEFTAAEIVGLIRHPILHDLASALVYITSDNDIMGFPVISKREGESNILELADVTGKRRQVNGNLIIAHPFDLINYRRLDEYRRYVYHNKIDQPFNQVFREYYPFIRDVLGADIYHRFQGRPVQKDKMDRLLRERGWRTDCGTWMQKVWRQENIISRICAAESPRSYAPVPVLPDDGTGGWILETVRFVSRDKFELIPFMDVPPVVFSETMRDIDIVSYESRGTEFAFQASDSILETRAAVAREMLAARSIDNVLLEAEYAQITGSMNVYRLHMGTGAVYKPGMVKVRMPPATTMAIRRVFTPFYDGDSACDAETLEIVSNIMLLANDKKIKDIGLLEQLEADKLLPPIDFL